MWGAEASSSWEWLHSTRPVGVFGSYITSIGRCSLDSVSGALPQIFPAVSSLVSSLDEARKKCSPESRPVSSQSEKTQFVGRT